MAENGKSSRKGLATKYAIEIAKQLTDAVAELLRSRGN